MYYMYICNSGSIQANTEGKSILSVGSRVELSGGHGRNRHTFFLAELYVCEILFDARSQIFCGVLRNGRNTNTNKEVNYTHPNGKKASRHDLR